MNNRRNLFMSVVVIAKNNSSSILEVLRDLSGAISLMVTDYEIVIVDNASEDSTVSVLKDLTSEGGLPNLQVYALTKEVGSDLAAWVGVENSLGDYVVVVDPFVEDVKFIEVMLEQATNGSDVVFTRNLNAAHRALIYRSLSWCFNTFYKTISGINLSKEAPQFRLLNKKVINFILQHRQPGVAYRHLPATSGFSRSNLHYSHSPTQAPVVNFTESVDKSINLMVSTTRVPMRTVTALSLFGALANLLYSIYVVAIGIFKDDVAPGWISLSLQQSGMFFLISLVLLVLGEYILHMSSLTNEGPEYHVAQEFTSAHMTRFEKLNIEEAKHTTEKKFVAEGPALQ